MQVELREKPLRCLHKAVDEIIIRLAAHARVPIAEIERVAEQTLAVRPAIEHDGQHRRGVDPRRRCIYHQFSDGDVRAVRPPVADAEDALRIRCNDQADLTPARRRAQCLLDLLGAVDGEIGGLLRVDELLAVLLNALRDHGIVDDRH